jgi:hypothetical protein
MTIKINLQQKQNFHVRKHFKTPYKMPFNKHLKYHIKILNHGF